MTEKELLSGLLSAAYQMDETGVAALYNADGSLKDDALQTLKDKDAERIKAVKPDTQKYFDDGFKKAEKEIKSAQEKEFLQKTGFKSDKKGIELYLEYAAEQAKANTNAITEDVIKKHPLYIATVDKLQQEKADAVKAESDKLVQFQSEQAKKETFETAKQKALEIFDSLKPVLSQDAARAAAQKELFIEKLRSYEIEKQGDTLVVLKDGKVLEDNHGHRIKFDSIVKETAARYYDFHVAEPRGSAGNGKPVPNGADGKPLNIPVLKTQAEVNAFIADSKNPIEVRTAVSEAWEKQSAAPATT